MTNEKRSRPCVLQVRLPLCCLPLQRRLHRLISLLKRIESLALLTHTNWNLTRVSKSFLFPTGAFRGYKTPAKLTGSHFLSPFCLPSLHSLYSLVALFVLLPARWHLNFPSPLSPLPSSPSFFSFFALAFTQNVYHVFSISRALFLARQIVQPLSCESVSIPANVRAYKYALPVDQVWTDLSCKALHLQSHTNMFVCFLAEI